MFIILPSSCFPQYFEAKCQVENEDVINYLIPY